MKLEDINKLVLLCRNCELYRTRTQAVPGQGNPVADIMFIGEAPGKDEDEQGIPFCGRSGALLDELMESIGLDRKTVYIANILKCRPPGNANPTQEQIKLCTPYLTRQINAIEPKVICCLGKFSSEFIMNELGIGHEWLGIGECHGRAYQIGKVAVVPLYHPAFGLYNNSNKPILFNDFKVIKELL